MVKKDKIHRADQLALGGHIKDAYFYLLDLELAFKHYGVKYMGDDKVYIKPLIQVMDKLKKEFKKKGTNV
tara:strand:- start:543 stop:752 length:210 start_codon:yes stop_codon:yes gene_type:complete